MSINRPFEKAQEAFLATLAETDQAGFTCSSPDDLIQALRQLDFLSKAGQKKKLNRCLTFVKELNDRLQPYFDALNVLAGAEQYAALAYGAFRVVLKLASAFPSFFEKFIALLGRLAHTFPQYHDIVTIFDGEPPARMRHHLESVYQDIFEFLQTAARIFTASTGKVKRPLSMIATVIWEPFDTRFNGLIMRMDDHRKFIMDELKIAQAKQTKDAEQAAALERVQAEKWRQRITQDKEKLGELANGMEQMKRTMDKDARESSIQRIQDWLAPPPFAVILENSQEQREDGTAQWIFSDPAFIEWRSAKPTIENGVKWNKMPPWVLWVHGNPGCGKTLLASSVIEELVEDGDSQSRLDETCYFFFNYNDPTNLTIGAAYRSALAQILHRSRDDNAILDKLLFARYSPTSLSGQSIASNTELLDLMRVCSSELGHITLVLDGIDESSEPDSLISNLKLLVTTAPIKLICFSRANVHSLQKQVAHVHRVGFDRKATNLDIRLFLIQHLETFLDDEMLPPSADINVLADSLAYGADGMFLWAKLMIKYLSLPALKPDSRLKTINSVRFPEGLSAMYDRIIILISKSDSPDFDLARRILLWLSNSIYIIGSTPLALQTAVEFEDHPGGLDHFASVAITVCGGLVEFTLQRTFQFTHLTVGEYFRDQPWSRLGFATPFVPGQEEAAVQITLRCVEYLLTHAPVETPAKLSPFWNIRPDIDHLSTFETYAARNWGQHLSHAKPNQLMLADSQSMAVRNALQLLDSISTFLQTPLAVIFWIYCLYKSGTLIEDVLEHIEFWSYQAEIFGAKITSMRKMLYVAKDLHDLTEEIRAVDKEWSSKLWQEPSLIWDDVLAFNAGKTLSKIAGASRISPVTTLAPEVPKDSGGKRVQCLCTISSAAANEMEVGVLSVYPSREFEDFWKNANSEIVYQEAEKFCSGWSAKYELWSLDSKRRLASLEISLPETEILLVIRQSFRQNPFKRGNLSLNQQYQCNAGDDKCLETSFPLAIDHDCRTFAILRTLYTICQVGSESSSIEYQAFLLPLEFLDHFDCKWTPHLGTFNPDQFAELPEIFRLTWRDWYTYSISFSPDGRFLSFADYQQPCVTHLAVFELLRDPQFSPRLVRQTMARHGLPRVNKMIFHPILTLLAFLSEMKVWIWDFSNGESKPVHLASQFDKCRRSISVMVSQCAQHKRLFTDCIRQTLNFSVCGKFVLTRHVKDVEVLHIPEKMLASTARGCIMEEHPAELGKLSNTELLKRTPDMLEVFNSALSPGSVISGTYLGPSEKSSNGNNTKALVVTHFNNEIKLQSAGTPEHLQLLTLPRSFDVSNTAISLQLPMTCNGSLNIIFNKTASDEYSLSDGKEGQFPKIVERNSKSISRFLSETTVSDRLSIHDGNQQPPTKRLKQ